jgi:hypothetical protein
MADWKKNGIPVDKTIVHHYECLYLIAKAVLE